MVYKVLYVENGATGGGSAESLVQLVSVLDQDKYYPIVVFTSHNPAVDRFISMNVETLVIKNWYLSGKGRKRPISLARLMRILVIYGACRIPRISLAVERLITSSARRKIVELVRKKSVDLVHTNNNPNRDLWAIEAAAQAGVPCVSHVRSFHSFGFSQCRALLVNRCASCFIVYSRSIADHWAEKGLSEKKQKVVLNAIGEVSKKSVNLKDIFGIQKSVPVLGIVGRIIPERGHDQLIRALPMLIKRFPSLKLLVIGSTQTDYAEEVMSLAHHLRVRSSIIFTGHRADATAIIGSLSALVLPYTIEPFGRVLLESWQLGSPVVLSNVGHITDIVNDRKDVLLFHPEENDDLVEKISWVLTDKTLRSQLIKNGKVNCRSNFSIHDQYNVVEKLYRSLIQK